MKFITLTLFDGSLIYVAAAHIEALFERPGDRGQRVCHVRTENAEMAVKESAATIIELLQAAG